jgi:hypothetical protein
MLAHYGYFALILAVLALAVYGALALFQMTRSPATRRLNIAYVLLQFSYGACANTEGPATQARHFYSAIAEQCSRCIAGVGFVVFLWLAFKFEGRHFASHRLRLVSYAFSF